MVAMSALARWRTALPLLTLAARSSSLTVPQPRIFAATSNLVPRHRALCATADGGEQQPEQSGDMLVTAISGDGSISAKAIVTTELIAETSRLQGLGGLAAAALGRAITCTLLVADGLKEEETFQVNFQGDGPLRGVLAIANGRLEARGYVGNPAVTLPPNALGKFDVGAGVGKGS